MVSMTEDFILGLIAYVTLRRVANNPTRMMRSR
jgi:hypothetical protein